jgi:hypothetical protein
MSNDQPGKLIYVDQNILSHLHSGSIELNAEGCTFVYSNSHFDEAARSKMGESAPELQVLNDLKARRLESEMADGRLTGHATLKPFEELGQAYERYQSTIAETAWDAQPFQQMLAALFGNEDAEATQSIPAQLRRNLESLMLESGLEGERGFPMPADVVKPATDLVDVLLQNPVKLVPNRAALGFPRGASNLSDSHENPLHTIWNILEPSVRGITPQQFFGFSHFADGEWKPQMPFPAIVSAYTVLNYLGFWPDSGLPDPNAWQNIMSDAQHAGMGAYCTMLLTTDKRLRAKAEAIYRFGGFGGSVPKISLSKKTGKTTINIQVAD